MQLVMAELQRRGVANSHTLAYQSRVGPVEWLKPYTDDSIRCGTGGQGGGQGAGSRRSWAAAQPVRLAGSVLAAAQSPRRNSTRKLR